MLPAILLIALVVEPGTQLRAAPDMAAARHAPLQRGEWLEVRSTRGPYLQVYDHRRERPGYVRATSVKTYPMAAESGPALLAVVDFLKDSPGNEALGMGYVAAYLRATAPEQPPPALMDALGGMSDRLARRASQERSADVALGPDLEVAASYGVHLVTVETGGRARLCYDGEAFRSVLASPKADDVMKARAALSLTKAQCVPDSITPTQEREWNVWRAQLLAPLAVQMLTPDLANRVQLRRVEVQAALVTAWARLKKHDLAAQAAAEVVAAFGAISRAELTADDARTYDEAALLTGMARHALERDVPLAAGSQLLVEVVDEEDGGTCLRITHRKTNVVSQECTHGVLWRGSIQIAPKDAAVTVVVQPLAGWSELWVLRPNGKGWTRDVLTAGTETFLGYVECAGVSPDGRHLLLVKESLEPAATPLHREFQLVAVENLRVERASSNMRGFRAFERWSSPTWRAGTVAVRG